jgi:vitamin B12 transporter
MKKLLVMLAAVVFSTSTVFAAQAKDAEETNGTEVFLTLTRTPESTEKLPTNVEIITSQRITEKGARNLGEILENEPSIFFKSNGTLGSASSVFVRGASSAQVLVLIDGRRVNDLGLGIPNLTSVPSAIIDRVEIIRGAGASVYGTSAFGGVINVITKKANPDTKLVTANGSYGTFNTINGSVAVGAANDTFNAMVIPMFLSSDNFRPNSGFVSRSVFLNTGAKIASTANVQISGMFYGDSMGNPGTLSAPSATDSMTDYNRYLKLDFNKTFNRDSLNVSAYISNNIRNNYMSYEDMYNPGSFIHADNKYTSQTEGAVATYNVNKFLTAGLEYWKDTYKDDDTTNNTVNSNDTRETSAGFVQANVELGKFTFIPSVRYDINTAFDNVFTPAVSVVYNANEHIKLSGNTGKVWRAPDFTSIYGVPSAYMIANPDIKPETGVASDIGIELSNDNLKFIATGFYTLTDDLLVYYSDPITWDGQMRNVNKSRQYGVELEAGQIINSWIKHTVNYTYLKAEDADTNAAITYKPFGTASYTLNVNPIEKLKTSATVSYVSSMYVTKNDPYGSMDRSLEAFFTLDLRADYMINEYFSLWVKGQNVGNAQYQTTYDYPMPGAVVYGGVEIRI